MAASYPVHYRRRRAWQSFLSPFLLYAVPISSTPGGCLSIRSSLWQWVTENGVVVVWWTTQEVSLLYQHTDAVSTYTIGVTTENLPTTGCRVCGVGLFRISVRRTLEIFPSPLLLFPQFPSTSFTLLPPLFDGIGDVTVGEVWFWMSVCVRFGYVGLTAPDRVA